MEELRLIMGAGISELETLQTAVDTNAASYRSVMKAYLTADVGELERLIKGSWEGDVGRILRKISELRLAIRKRRIPEDLLEKLEAEKHSQDLLLEAEIHFVLGLAFEVIKRDRASVPYFEHAAKCYAHARLPRKAVKAKLNVVASKSRAFPDKNYFTDYSLVARESRKLKEFSVAGTCYMNMARDFQLLKAYRPALKYINISIGLFAREPGSVGFYLSRIAKADILLDLGDPSGALFEIEFCRMAHFPEVVTALEVIDAKIAKLYKDARAKPLNQVASSELLNMSWRDRAQEVDSLVNEKTLLAGVSKQSPMSERLIHLLSKGPADRFEIMQALWGDGSADLDSLEGRFKNLLHNVRKRSGYIILCTQGRYHLSETILPRKRGAS